ncbi:MAG: preprotein translocase subunit YajC [bacterium]
MNNLISILLQAQGSNTMSMVFLVAIIFVFYFFMIRPQMKKQKLEKDFRNSLQKGAKVVTIGGMHGRILDVNDRTFMIEIDTNVKVRVEKSAISAEATKAIDQNIPAKV